MTRFFVQALLNFKSVGSFTPSSATLCDALVQPIVGLSNANVLEVGSGDGAVANHLISHYNKQVSELWVNELNPTLFGMCKDNLEAAELNHIELFLNKGAFEDMTLPHKHFDVVISSLPLNSLSHDEVMCVLERFKQVLKVSPHATFCFYEYLGSRLLNTMHSMVSSEATLTSALFEVFDGDKFSSQLVLKNFPPAKVWTIQREL